MKKSDYDFSMPIRQSYAAILIIIYRLYKVLVRQLWPLLIVFLFDGKLTKANNLVFIAIVIAIGGSIYGIIAFFKHYFYIQNRELVIEKGVFRRTKTEIPLERIQTVNFEQNIIHRIFNVVKLKLDTAGSSKSEMELYALDRDMASALSDIILKNKARRKEKTVGQGQKSQDDAEDIFILDNSQLVKVGLTENHLRSGILIIFFFVWIFDNLREIGLNVDERLQDTLPQAQAFVQSIVLVLVLIGFFALVSVVISMIRSVLTYYRLRFSRSDKGFKIESGLFNRREVAARDTKIQILSWSQNLLQKTINLFKIKLKQASSTEVNTKRSIVVPGLSEEDVNKTRQYLFPSGFDDIIFEKVSIHFLLRRVMYWSVIGVPALAVSFIYAGLTTCLLALLFYSYGMLGSFMRYRKLRFGLNDEVMVLKGGVFGESNAQILLHKIQSLSISQNLYQKRRELSNLSIYTASGALVIPYISKQRSVEMLDLLMAKVENDTRPWM